MLLARWIPVVPFRASRTLAARGNPIRRRNPIARRSASRIRVEALEERTLLSATPLGSEALVNASTAGIQRTGAGDGRSLAVAPDNSYVVVWTSSQGDGSGYGVYARRFAVDGTPLSGEILVNTTTANDQSEPAVAVNSSGGFVVAWQSQSKDGSGTAVVARQFDASGNPLGGEILVNQTTAGNQQLPSVACLTGGGFAVAWSGNGTGDSSGAFARIFNSSGTAMTNELRVNQTTANTQSNAAIASDGAGGFAVAWQGNGTGDASGVFFRRFNSAGTALTGEIRVNQTTSGTQQLPSIAVRSDGTFVVAWSGNGTGDSAGVFFRRLTATGGVVGNEVRANQTTSGTQQAPSVAASGTTFTIAWAGAGTGDGDGVFFRQFNATGGATTNETHANTTVANSQNQPTAAALNGGLVIDWSGNGAGDSSGVFVQRYTNYDFIVNSTADTVDAHPGDGVATDSTGHVTLRSAIMEANALQLPVPVVISLGANTYALTLAGANEDADATGDLDVKSLIEIDGVGSTGSSVTTIDARSLDRDFEVFAGASLTLSKVKVTGGNATNSGPAGGGAVDATDADVILNNSLMTGNKTTSTTTDFAGGGIAADGGKLFITNTTISGNTATGTVAAATGYAGGVIGLDDALVNIVNSHIDNNTADEGGGLYLYDGAVGQISGGTVSGNSATASGGGIDVELASATITGTTVANNTATTDEGGGLWNFGGNVQIAGVTISNNKAGRSGGGIENTGRITAAIGTMSIGAGTTISGNSAPDGGGIFNSRDSILTIDSTSITGNTATTGNGGGISNSNTESFGPGHVTITNSTISNNQAAVYGGALFAIKNLTDISNTTIQHNSATEGGGLANIDAGVMTVDQSLVDGNTAGHEGGGLTEEEASLTVTDTTVSNNTVTGHGGGIYSFAGTVDIAGSAFTGNVANGGDGGGVENTGRITAAIGHMTIDDSTFTNNTANNGGGIDNKRDSVMSLTNSTVTGNTAVVSGGGVSNLNTESFGPGTLTIGDTLISGNTAGDYGGGLFDIKNIATVTGSTISDNTGVQGGGVGIDDDGQVTVTSSLVDGNTASLVGGGLYNDEGDLDVIDSTVSNNKVTGEDGGGLDSFAGTVDISGSAFTGNTASGFGGAVENTGRITAAIGMMTIEDSTFTGNSANIGGAIDNKRDSIMTITGCTVTGNTAASGGGVSNYNNESFGPGTLTIEFSTIAGNTAASDGGGVFTLKNTTNIESSTLSGNSAHEGGGISNRGTATLDVVNSTISANQAHEGGGVYVMDVSTATFVNDTIAANSADIAGGAVADSGTTVSVGNTIIAQNTGTTSDPDLEGAFVSLGHNLIGIGDTGTGFTNGVNGDQVGSTATPIDPHLGPLGDNGGPTQTMALLAGSTAIDAGDNTLAANAGLTTDQRGESRVQDGDSNGSAIVDIGAYEFNPADPVFASAGTLGGILNST